MVCRNIISQWTINIILSSSLQSLVWEEREQKWARIPRRQHPKRGSYLCSKCRQVILGSNVLSLPLHARQLSNQQYWTSATHALLNSHCTFSYSILFCIIVVYVFISIEGQRVKFRDTPQKVTRQRNSSELHIGPYHTNQPFYSSWFLSKPFMSGINFHFTTCRIRNQLGAKKK